MIYSQTTPIVQLVQEDIDFISQIPISDNEDNTYTTDIENIDTIVESYGLSIIDSVSLLEELNNIDNLSISIPDWYVYSNPDILTESVPYSIYSTQGDEEDQRLQYIIENYDNWEDIILEGINIASKRTGKEAEQSRIPESGDDKPSTSKESKKSDGPSWLSRNKKHLKTAGRGAAVLGGIGFVGRTLYKAHNRNKSGSSSTSGDSPNTAYMKRTILSLPTNKVSEQIFRLRRIYSDYLAKANSARNSGKASFFKRQAARILTLIDKLLAMTTRATNKVGDAAWNIRKKLK